MMVTSVAVNVRAKLLVQELSDRLRNGTPWGSMSTTLYDTAWVSMVRKEVHGQCHWLFPSSFQIILDEQVPEGGWDSRATALDNLLTSMACLISLVYHRAKHLDTMASILPNDIDARIQSATAWLQRQLDISDIHAIAGDYVELLIPTHLRLLKAYNISFTFPEQHCLMELYAKTLSKTNVALVYRQAHTAAHSLEAFVENLTVDSIKVQPHNGSIGSSPSATAAFLIHSSVCNKDAENYLQNTSIYGPGNGSGSFPSTFPSELFEIVWMLSTLLESGFTEDELVSDNIRFLSGYIRESLEEGHGLLGFTRGVLPNADDTSKALSTLSLLNELRDVGLDGSQLVEAFYNGQYFHPYSMDRTFSFNSNCNAIMALLALNNADQYAEQIKSAMYHLCRAFHVGGMVKDRRNRSSTYSYVLLCQALSQLLRSHDLGKMGFLPPELLNFDVPLVLLQVLSEILLSQEDGGYWSGRNPEVTAYALLALNECVDLPCTTFLRPGIVAAISAGKCFLLTEIDSWQKGTKVWTGKVAYASSVLSTTYCLAAVRASPRNHAWKQLWPSVESNGLMKLSRFFARLPLFSKAKSRDMLLQCAASSGLPLLDSLRTQRSKVFPPKPGEEDDYLKYIPFTWTACNNLGTRMPTQLLQEMTVLSMLNYQVDEYMETVVEPVFSRSPQAVKTMIDELCTGSPTPEYHDGASRTLTKNGHQSENSANYRDLEAIHDTLGRYVSHILQHPSVVQSPPAIQATLRQDINAFLHAHVTQMSDNKRLAVDTPTGPRIQVQEYCTLHKWIRATGAIHTSCPMSFTFYCCLVSKEGAYCFHSVQQKYLAADLCANLAAMCRMYNDYGSEKRDQAECNLNSLDFIDTGGIDGVDVDVENRIAAHDNGAASSRKRGLLWIAEYERRRLMNVLQELKATGLSEAIVRALQLFIDVTDLYGQLYVARDIGVAAK